MAGRILHGVSTVMKAGYFVYILYIYRLQLCEMIKQGHPSRGVLKA
jgi:hypothetical protein